jgi:hypothetical protein
MGQYIAEKMEMSQNAQEIVSHVKRNGRAIASLPELYHHPLTGSL